MRRVRHWLIQLCFGISDDYNRVVLDTIEGEHDSDYVNASYVDVSRVGGGNVINVMETRVYFPEPTKTERLHRDTGSYWGNGHRLLANGVAGKGQLHCHAHQNLWFHQSESEKIEKNSKVDVLFKGDVRPVLAGLQWAGGDLWRDPHQSDPGRGTGQLPHSNVSTVQNGQGSRLGPIWHSTVDSNFFFSPRQWQRSGLSSSSISPSGTVTRVRSEMHFWSSEGESVLWLVIASSPRRRGQWWCIASEYIRGLTTLTHFFKFYPLEIRK